MTVEIRPIEGKRELTASILDGLKSKGHSQSDIARKLGALLSESPERIETRRDAGGVAIDRGQVMSSKPGGISAAWGFYLRWNEAVAEVIYPVNDDAMPAYMDLETEELQMIAQHAGYTGTDPRQAFAEAVRAVVVDGDGRFSLKALNHRAKVWRAGKERRNPPPTLAFLAITSLAAEDMGKTDDDIAGHAYYVRLAKLLGFSMNDGELQQQYARHAEFLWGCLNSWLEDLDGERGMPTAYALTFRYVGLPMSQALVREGDRKKFPAMFAQFGLSPGMEIAPADLSSYLDHWFSLENSPASKNLRKLWNRQSARERIASVAAVELANWDGTLEDASAVSVGGTTLATRAMVIANLRSGFLDSSLDLSLGLRPLVNDMDGQMQVRSVDDSWIDIGFSPGTAGLWRTSYTEAVEFGSILEGAVRIRHADREDAAEYKRFPRTVIPLVYDELQSAFVESERLQLGTDSLLLVRTVAQTKVKTNVVEEVERALNEAARPGFKRIDDLSGLPEGWVLFTDIQLFGAPNTIRLNELIPLARNNLTIAGGLRIPSRVRKWSTLSPPEVRAAVQSEPDLRVTLIDSRSEEVVCEWTSESGVLVAPLADAKLEDGNYRVSLFTGTKKVPVQQTSIRLRSSSEPDVLWNTAPRLVYQLGEPLGVLSATENGDATGPYVDGVVSSGSAGIKPTARATGKVTWAGPRPVVQRQTIRIGTPDPTSCIATGAHHLILPPFMGKATSKFIDGECKSCGLVKRFPAWGKSKWNRKSGGSSGEIVDVRDLDAVDGQSRPNWDVALDALMHLGGGSINSLESIALQLEGSSLFVGNFVRTLEMLGHIAIERDDAFRPIRWEISPSCLAQTSMGTYRTTGFWPPNLMEDIREQARQHSATVVIEPVEDGPMTCVIHDIDQADAALLTTNHEDIAIVAEAGHCLLSVLPRLSAVADALPRSPMPGFQTAERFDVSSASWIETGDPYAPGAYRLRRGFETLYIYRSEADVAAGSAAVAPVHLAKHLAANAIGQTIVSYQDKIETILLPQGSELPGLYGRAVVAMSGQPPATKRVSLKDGPKRKCLLYSGIERSSADLLVTLLTT